MAIKDYIIRRVAGSNYLVYIGTPGSEYISPICINSVGADICELLLEGKSESEVSGALATRYEMTEDELREDVKVFVEQLRSAGISIK